MKKGNKNIKKSQKKDQSHTTGTERHVIASGLDEGKKLKDIAAEINKDPTTVSKEIKNKREMSVRISPFDGTKRLPCIHIKDCERHLICDNPCGRVKCAGCHKCHILCPEFELMLCKRLKRFPYVCNGCKDKKGCNKDVKYTYDPINAQVRYENVLHESRKGINMTKDELARINSLVSPLILEKGQSVHTIYVNHKDELDLSQSSIYRLVDAGLLDARNIDLIRKVKYKKRRVHKKLKPGYKEGKKGKTNDDFLKYVEEHPDANVIQMDTVIGKKEGGEPVILSLHCPATHLQTYVLMPSKESRHLKKVFEHYYKKFDDEELFLKYFAVIKTDNGVEFSDVEYLESLGIKVFYCEPNRSDQKAECEKNHTYLRKYLPKGSSFTALKQRHVREITSHVSNTPRKSLNDKTPYEMTQFIWGRKLLDALSIKKIEPDDVYEDRKLFDKIIRKNELKEFKHKTFDYFKID